MSNSNWQVATRSSQRNGKPQTNGRRVCNCTALARVPAVRFALCKRHEEAETWRRAPGHWPQCGEGGRALAASSTVEDMRKTGR